MSTGEINGVKVRYWGGFALPAHLDYDEAVEHCVEHIKRECEGVGAAVPDLDACELLLRSWGLNMAVTLLFLALDMSGKKKEWMVLREKKEAQNEESDD